MLAVRNGGTGARQAAVIGEKDPLVPGHRVRFQPPLLFAALFGGGLLLHVIWPLELVGTGFSTALRIIGAVLLAGSLLLIGAALTTLRAAHTPINPNLPPAQLVTTGPFRWSRNPVYLSFCLALAGLGLVLANGWLLLAPAVAVPLLTWGVIGREEAKLRAHYGDEYGRYAARVRRWL